MKKHIPIGNDKLDFLATRPNEDLGYGRLRQMELGCNPPTPGLEAAIECETMSVHQSRPKKGLAMIPETNPQPLQVFVSYAHSDEALRGELAKHMSGLQREGAIASWDDHKIVAGDEWQDAIDQTLGRAQLVLLLVSADFLASDYCYSRELGLALERHEAGLARVIPIILRPVDWQNSPFARLQALPRNGMPVTSWPDRDEAFLDVAQGIRRAAATMRPVPTAVVPVGPRVTYSIEIAGTIKEFDHERLETIVQELQSMSGDISLTIKRMEPGSVILVVEGTREGYESLRRLLDGHGSVGSFRVLAIQGPPVSVSTKVPHRGVRLFVGNLPFAAEEDDVRTLFEQKGLSVTEVKLITDRETGRPRGFGFVEMGSSHDADAAIRELNGVDFRGRQLSVSESGDRKAAGRERSN